MRLTFHGAVKQVTGANYLLESNVNGQISKVLVDCGLHQGSNFCEKHNWENFPYDPKEIAAVFVTHAHIDHTGRLPKLVRDGFRGKIYSTPPTKDFAYELLLDSEGILQKEAKKHKRPPLYEEQDIKELISHWEGVEYHKPVKIGPFTATFYNAGHILGSSFIVIDVLSNFGTPEVRKRIIFSGDLGNSPAPIIGAREAPPDDVDYCLIESTYGNRLHEDIERRKEIVEDLIEDTVKAGGTLMIPAFAMERTQELIFEVNELAENGRIPRVPIFIDSPLAIKLTDVYNKYFQYFDEETKKLVSRGDSIFKFPGLKKTLTSEESKTINDVKPPKVIIAGSGMMNGGRILHHAKRYLPDPHSTLLMIGYQAAGSLGRQILEGVKIVKIHGEEVTVRCRVVNISGYSAHADQSQLLEWLKPMHLSLKKVWTVQGEEESARALAQKARDELAIDAEIPEDGRGYEL